MATRANAPSAKPKARMPGSTMRLESDFEPVDMSKSINAIQTQNGKTSESNSHERQCTRFRAETTIGVTTTAATTA